MNKLTKTTCLAAIALGITILFGSCSSHQSLAYKEMTIKAGYLPEDMATQKFTVIGVLHGRKSYDKYLKRGFATYTGSYVLAKREDIEKQYPDIEKYRYIFDYDTKTMSYGYTTGTFKANHFYVYDRKTEKKYADGVGPVNNFGARIKDYTKAIDEARKEGLKIK